MIKGEDIKREDIDDCVVCGRKSEELKSTDISRRMYYVEGAGQVCYKCADKLF